jgi:hypothetical protein
MSCISITVAYQLSPQDLVQMKNTDTIAETPQNMVSNKVQDFSELEIDPFLCPIPEYTLLLFPHVLLFKLLCTLLKDGILL